MKTPEKERLGVNTREELERTITLQLERDDLSQVQIGEGPERIIIAGPQTRHCGDCEYCCTAAGINELQKPSHVRCKHLARRPQRGCGIYRQPGVFPKACGDFKCAWLIGNFEGRHRPDKIGAYVAFFQTEDFGFYAVVQCDTKRLDKKRLGELVAILFRKVPKIYIIYDDKYGTVLHWGHPPLRVLVGKRPPGEYEVLPLMISVD